MPGDNDTDRDMVVYPCERIAFARIHNHVSISIIIPWHCYRFPLISLTPLQSPHQAPVHVHNETLTRSAHDACTAHVTYHNRYRQCCQVGNQALLREVLHEPPALARWVALPRFLLSLPVG